MKTKPLFLFCFVLFALSNTTIAQSNGLQAIKGLKFTAKQSKQLKTLNLQSVMVNQQGIMRTRPGYHMVLSKSKNTVYVKRFGTKIGGKTFADEEKIIAPGVKLVCRGCEACRIAGVPNDYGQMEYSCQGDCGDRGCDEFIKVDVSLDVEFIEN